MVLWDTSPSSSQSAGFLNKVTIPCRNNSFQFTGLVYGLGFDNGDLALPRENHAGTTGTFSYLLGDALPSLASYRSILGGQEAVDLY